LKECGIGVTVAHSSTRGTEWFDSTLPLKLHPQLNGSIAMKFRKKWVRGFITPGGCNYYMGLSLGENIIGVLGFSNPDYGEYDILLKADTTPAIFKKSTDLLLYVMRTQEAKRYLEDRFCREINNCYTLAFSQKPDISRYRKHGERITKNPIKEKGNIVGYRIGYLFKLGEIPSIKAAKKTWMQKHGI